MSSGSALLHIDAVDAVARNLHIRVQASTSDAVKTIALPLRNLHLALRHLRIEAADKDSLLNSQADDVALYSRQLKPLVEDCEFALKQLEAFLNRFENDADRKEKVDDGHLGNTADVEEERRMRVKAIKTTLVSDKTKVDMFLDTVQLQKCRLEEECRLSATQDVSLEGIKDKVDAVASKVFHARATADCAENDEDDYWKDFKSELEKEGFSSQVLQKHKDVIRAYIRELESARTADDGPLPSVRGLLEYEASPSPPWYTSPVELPAEHNSYPPHVPPKVPLSDADPLRPPRQGAYKPREENVARGPRRSSAEDQPQQTQAVRRYSNKDQLQPISIPKEGNLSFERTFEDEFYEEDASSTDSMALISTKDLLAMDVLNANMANMHLQSSQVPSGNYLSSQPRLPPTSSPQLLHAPPVRDTEYSSSANPDLLGSAPRYVPPLLGSSPTYQDIPQPRSRLAPDPFGKEIPADAQWTKVRRTLISPEVLHHAGVRYEARPGYVAILGRLSKDQIAEFARQSADARAARTTRPPPPYRPSPPTQSQPLPSTLAPPTQPQRRQSMSATSAPPSQNRARSSSDPSRSKYKDKDKDKDDESVLWDESDTASCASDPRPYQYIVDPPSKKISPSSTVPPKSILKNKNENHVRFDPHPHEVSPERSSRHGYDDKRRSRDRYGRSTGSGSSNGAGGRREDRYDNGSGGRYAGREGRDSTSNRTGRKKAWGETLGAVGIGGAALSLLGVLAEASLN